MSAVKSANRARVRPDGVKAAGGHAGGGGGAGGVGGIGGRLARQRRFGVLAAGVLLVAMAVVLNSYLFHAAGQRVEVVRVARDVAAGQALSAADVDVARVAVDGAVATIPKSQLPQVVGKHAVVGLRKGTLLAASQLTMRVSPGAGQALVTVPVKAGAVPPGIAPGWQVRVVFTAGGQAQAGGSGPVTVPQDVPALVDQVTGPDTEGAVSVSLVVADAAAGVVARQGAAGLVVLVVTGRQG